MMMNGKTAKQLHEEARQGNINMFRKFCRIFYRDYSMEAITELGKMRDILHDSFGMTWDELEQIEIEEII